MNEWLTSALNMVLFKPGAYEAHVARQDVFKRGLLMLVVVTLVAGVLSFAIDAVGALRPVSLQQQRQEFEKWLENPMGFLGPMGRGMEMPPEFRQQLPDIRKGFEMGMKIENLPTPLPKVFGRLFEKVGKFLSTPFSRLAGWMGYALWVLLAAKLLGGRATLPRMLGATAVYSVPHLLELLGFIPCLGGLLGLAAGLWGLAVYVKAVAAANDFPLGRAILATVLPAAILFVVGLLATAGVGVAVALASR